MISIAINKNEEDEIYSLDNPANIEGNGFNVLEA
jgi:hypothetical protein